ncbi:TonB-dependent receptor [Thalassotalea sp. 1_MG-2023]|uniref:TonB-dependent receptor n=1 Tax=Thalassotalea sp. 1_MG-2023 TaxID=3062680 RepID=UPI0026E3C3FC|nr:TonB-dependent receptor [Thalassotalea sp. 1_MG-2023]MDO6428611.1 TonB-dependent receptor [Thalassotalea sp. 1_MG-2023]
MLTRVHPRQAHGVKLSKLSIAIALVSAFSSYSYAAEDQSNTRNIKSSEQVMLDEIDVSASSVHQAQSLRKQAVEASSVSRSSVQVSGGELNYQNAVKTLNSLQHSVSGMLTSPGSSGHFGGGTKIRTFGDFGAATSIDGLPTFRLTETEGGGYSQTLIPNGAIESVTVHKGSQGVMYGDGTDGGTIVTQIKSGRHYKDHVAISADYSTADEKQVQLELANGTKQGDYYITGRWLDGDYQGTPQNMEQQTVKGGVAKFGWNFSEKTRLEALFISNNSKPLIYRAGALNEIKSRAMVSSMVLDHMVDKELSLQAGLVVSTSDMIWEARNRDRGTDNKILFTNAFFSKSLDKNWGYIGSVGAEISKIDSYRDKQWHNQFNDKSIKNSNTFTYKKDLAITVGLRNTWFDNEIELNNDVQADNLVTDSVLSYELSSSYLFTSGVKLRGSIASGFNRYYAKYGNFGTDALNPDGAGDEVVEALTYEVGANYQWDTGSVDIALYETEQDGVPRRNGGAIESMIVKQQGVELDWLHMLTDNLSVTANFTHIIDLDAIREDGTHVNGNIFWGNQVTPVPTNQFGMKVNYAINPTVSLWGKTFINSGFDSTQADGNVIERESYHLFDLGASWQFNAKTLLTARIENITDEHNYGTVIKGNDIPEETNIGRALWLGLKYTF